MISTKKNDWDIKTRFTNEWSRPKRTLLIIEISLAWRNRRWKYSQFEGESAERFCCIPNFVYIRWSPQNVFISDFLSLPYFYNRRNNQISIELEIIYRGTSSWHYERYMSIYLCCFKQKMSYVEQPDWILFEQEFNHLNLTHKENRLSVRETKKRQSSF